MSTSPNRHGHSHPFHRQPRGAGACALGLWRDVVYIETQRGNVYSLRTGKSPCLIGKSTTVGGIPTPLKNMKVTWDYYSKYGKIKNVPNHQPDYKWGIVNSYVKLPEGTLTGAVSQVSIASAVPFCKHGFGKSTNL